MWSARWGHAVVVANQTHPRNDFTEEENTELSNLGKPYLVLLGGDDYITDGYKSLISYTNHLSINSAGGQFRNDIWWMSPPIKTKYRWNVEGTNLHPRRNENNEPSTILSNTKWTQSNGGRIAPETWPSDHSKAVTFLDWIQCQEVFSNIRENRTSCSEPEEYCFENILNPGCKPEAVWKYNNMWSPRRGHGSIVANNKLFVIGGRAREVIDMQPSSMVGGIVESDNTIAIHELDHHAKAILKNDVWVSDDGLGKTWRLATPGCQDHQEDILLQTELWQAKYDTSAGSKLKSTIGRRCETSDDCFGAAICRNVDNVEYKTCVCPMFSPREHHTVVIQHRYRPDKGYKEDYIYVIGGFTSIRQSFCGNQVCKGQPSYRRALNDVWVSNNGIDWIQLAPASPKDGYFPPRGAHASLISYDKSAQRDQIWIFGGETSEPNDEITHYLPDVWRIDVSTDPCCMMESKCASFPQLLKIDDIGRCLPSKASFQKIKNHAIWQGRAGHTVVYEPALSRNLFQHQMYLMGGRNATTVFSDVWSWNFQLDSSWRKDFNLDQWYRSMDNGKLHFGPSTTHSPISNHGTPHSLYLTGDSSLAELMEVFLPQNRTHDLSNFTREFRVPLFTDDDVQILTRNNIRTLYDLATIELYDLLRLRGFDFPGEDSTPIPRVCQALSISRAFLNKCVAGKNWNTSNGERRLSKHYSEQSNVVRMVFGDLYYATIGDKCNSIDCVLTSWDGCSTIGKEIMVDVTGIGNVPVPRTDFDPRYLIEDMHCRTVPKARYFAAAEFLDNQVVLAGGHGLQENELFRDTWARDDMFPQASISHRPRDGTKDSVFFFESNEEGAKIFEYKINEIMNNKNTLSGLEAELLFLIFIYSKYKNKTIVGRSSKFIPRMSSP